MGLPVKMVVAGGAVMDSGMMLGSWDQLCASLVSLNTMGPCPQVGVAVGLSRLSMAWWYAAGAAGRSPPHAGGLVVHNSVVVCMWGTCSHCLCCVVSWSCDLFNL